ncbi:MAG: hypothetical protein KKE17_02335 [Proteobacteria bacterium]|nr:hypothetical protein [Pseudomonadota bacterium]MBU1708819.1 hypothetical protein [Pseudomonadota bacterium]
MLWASLGWPLLKLMIFVSIGLLVANVIEALNWTHKVAKLAGPLIRMGHLSDTCGASFSMAFFSGISANTMLAEAYDQGRMTKKELILANLFNSLPTYFLHLPTMFFITVPLIKSAAFVYVGLTLFAAFLRTIFVLLVGRLLLPVDDEVCVTCRLEENVSPGWQDVLHKAWDRFKVRIRKILTFTVPIYIGFFLFNKFGMFNQLELFIAEHVAFLSWLHPESLGIVVFHIAAEFTAGLAAAGALLDAGTLGSREIVLALLVGNIFSSPVRALRHQFPYYAGIFSPRLAMEIVLYNQIFRMGSIMVVAVMYYMY